MSVKVDGREVFSGFLEPGTSQTFTGNGISLVIGDAGATEVIYNGKSLGFLGRAGDVARQKYPLSEEQPASTGARPD